MPRPLEPDAVVRAVIDGVVALLNGDRSQLDRLPLLFAEQTDVRHPMDPLGGGPLRTRPELREHFAQGAAAGQVLRDFRAEDVVVHQTLDPEVVVVDFRYLGAGPGGPLVVANVFVTRVRDGVIVSSRDHTDHAAFARAARA